MAVVINDFEVVAEPAQGAKGGGAAKEQGETRGGGGGGSPAAPTPEDLRRALRRHLERLERVRAD
jgi:hypothetical protein